VGSNILTVHGMNEIKMCVYLKTMYDQY